jgi:hypothetical protein
MPAKTTLLPLLALTMTMVACGRQAAEAPRTEGAAAVRSEETMIQNAEALLDQGRFQEALGVLPASSPLYYVHFLRGVAFERLNQTGQARIEYGRFTTYGLTEPAPARFRIPGSRLQAEAEIRFQERIATGG